MLDNQALAEQYPFLNEYTTPVKHVERAIVGREKEMASIQAALMRPELCNVMLLGEAGSGKTAVVQGTMAKDTGRVYLEVDLSKMIANCKTDVNEMATKLKTLFDETADYCKTQEVEIVLFIDEFHQVVQLSNAAVEALKPLLADSGTRGIRVIAATTYTEFRKYIAPNQPLVERLQRINLEPPGKEVTIEILRGMAERYGVDSQFYNDSIYEMIYDYTNRYIPANSQPRKSLLVLDAMIGWHRSTGRPMNQQLLADVIYESEGVNVAFRVDATAIQKELDKHVLSQKLATRTLQERLQICVADLNDKSKPMSTFLFTGSSGTGKMLDDNEMVPVYSEDGTIYRKRNGDLRPGDIVFNRKGEPVTVVGVYPQGVQDVYTVTLRDGRVIRCGADHLWMYKSRAGNGSLEWRVARTSELIRKNMFTRNKEMQFVIPMNEAVKWPVREQPVDPYVVGVFLAVGVLRYPVFGIVTEDLFIIDKCQGILGGAGVSRDDGMGAYLYSGNTGPLPVGSVFGSLSDVTSMGRDTMFVPDEYKYASIEQRWQLIQGLFDAGGRIREKDAVPYQITYTTWSQKLAEDIQSVLWSLGVVSSIREISYRPRKDMTRTVKYLLRVSCPNSIKQNFFTTPDKRQIAAESVILDKTSPRRRKYDTVGIWSVDKLKERARMTCIEVDDSEHLYQAGEYIVTHNTETVKQLARILFDNGNHLIRMDMTEYANDDSLERFRRELTSRVWAQPYSIVLLDEIEKACAPVTRILLQVLDDGRLSDENNREVSFTNCYIIMTTNAGSEIYKNIAQYGVDDTGSGAQMARYDKLIRSSIMATTGDNKFPPELLGRIDCIVPFQPLSENTMKNIVKKKLLALKDEVQKKHGVRLRVSQKVIDYLVEENLDTDSDSGGARAVMSKLESEVTTAVAQFINANPNVMSMGVMIEGELATRNVNKLISSARVVVSATS